MPNNTLLIDARRCHTLPDLFATIAGSHQPVPRNLDGFADFLRQEHLRAVLLRNCRLSISDYTALANVCRDQGVALETC